MTQQLLKSRYGEGNQLSKHPSLSAISTTHETFNASLENLLAHRSVRSYLPDALEEGTLELLVAAAQSASSSSNLQVWSVIAVEDSERKEALSHYAGNQAHIREAPLLLVWLADLSRSDRLAKRLDKEVKAIDYLETFLVASIDAALAAQNAAVAAESLGLGTVYIGGIRNQPEHVSEVLGLPPLVFPIFGLVVGKPDPARPSVIKPRLPQEAVFFREKYGLSAEKEVEVISNYDTVLTSFQTTHGLPKLPWSQHVLSRLLGPEALHGREHLSRILHARGFHLS
ncbi:MAG: nitroreductase family protein [Pseudomonadota bacterium]